MLLADTGSEVFLRLGDARDGVASLEFDLQPAAEATALLGSVLDFVEAFSQKLAAVPRLSCRCSEQSLLSIGERRFSPAQQHSDRNVDILFQKVDILVQKVTLPNRKIDILAQKADLLVQKFHVLDDKVKSLVQNVDLRVRQ